MEKPIDKMDESAPPAFFPRSYVTELFRFINDNADKVQCITYRDFCWGDDVAYEDGYPDEWLRWRQRLSREEIDPRKVYVTVQYDVDTCPARTMSLLRDPLHENISANVMIFAKRLDRKFLVETKTLQYTDYTLDDQLLLNHQKRGGVVGYHFNAFERSGWDAARAQQIFAEDVSALRRRFDVDFCSAHGGVPGPDGRNNNSVHIPDELRSSLRWVHNKYSPRFNGQFSDGGHHNSKLSPTQRDIRDFVKSWRPGGRYRLLLHPQYYDLEFMPSPSYSGTAWYDDLVRNASTAGGDREKMAYALSSSNQPIVNSKPGKPKSPARTQAIMNKSSGVRALSTKAIVRLHKSLSRLRRTAEAPVTSSGYDGQILLAKASEPAHLPATISKVGVSEGGDAGGLLFPAAGKAGYILLGGGHWKGSGFSGLGSFFPSALFKPKDQDHQPWGGWPTTATNFYAISIETAGLAPPFEVRVICISYGKEGNVIAQKDIGSLNARRPMLHERFIPYTTAVGFNIALFKAIEQPGGHLKLTSVKLVRHVSS